MQSPTQSATSSIPSTSVASLLQSAVKFENEHTSPELFDDDDVCDTACYEHSTTQEASLESLRQIKLPPLPDEQDRKRFVGCVASVLAFVQHQPWRTRRHEHIAASLLANTAQLLQLDPAQSKCFLPMVVQQRQESAALPRGCSIETIRQHIPFLDSFLCDLTPGAGLRCLTFLLTQHLLASNEGYDARVRCALRIVGIVVLHHDKKQSDDDDDDSHLPVERQFEALEQAIAWKLILLSSASSASSNNNNNTHHHHHQQQQSSSFTHSSSTTPSSTTTRDRWVRGLKIGGTAVAAGTLFAISGGLAAPALATALAGTALATLASSTTAATAVFGVTGGSLVAYKMQRRTVGLTEFAFCRHTKSYELYSTICLSGWLEQDWDFDRPWGIMEEHMVDDPVERLERFYHVVRPCHVDKAKKIVQAFRGNEKLLYTELYKTYGKDPNHLYPLGPRPRLSPDDREVVDGIFVELGLGVAAESTTRSDSFTQPTPIERLQCADDIASCFENTSSHGEDDDDAVKDESSSSSTESRKPPKHLKTVWDYQHRYGGELYTVRWESKLLVELCDSVVDLAADLVSGATAQILKHTALATLVAAVALPVALTSAANMIDSTWTLVVERADAAGRELAQSLLYSTAGHRPVALVGFSFGARVIYTCLKTLARYQLEWEAFHAAAASQEQQQQKGKWRMRGRRRRNSAGSMTENGEDESDSLAFEKMREPASIAILMGTPNHLSTTSWEAIREVVAGRLVNCFSQKDMILSLMFQIKKFGGLKPVCGTTAVDVVGVENVDVTDLVAGHQDYCFVAGDILQRVHHGSPFPCGFQSQQEANEPSSSS